MTLLLFGKVEANKLFLRSFLSLFNKLAVIWLSVRQIVGDYDSIVFCMKLRFSLNWLLKSRYPKSLGGL